MIDPGPPSFGPTLQLDRLPPFVDREDAIQVVELARLEARASGFDPDASADEALAEFIREELQRNHKEAPATSRFRERDDGHRSIDATLGWLDDASKVVGLAPAKRQTPGQRKRFIRNQIIFAATLAGFSRRNIGLALGLPHSRISAIVDEMRARTGRD